MSDETTTDKIKKKFTDFTNTEFNDRHRFKFGPLPAQDIDMIEYKHNIPCIYFETKHGHLSLIDLTDDQMTRHKNTAKILNIPFFIVLYYFPGLNKYNEKVDEFGTKHKYFIIAANDLARSHMTYSYTQLMSEEQFVKFIYKIKNQPFPENLILDTEIDVIPDEPFIKGLPKSMEAA
jgi:hypothetical protein